MTNPGAELHGPGHGRPVNSPPKKYFPKVDPKFKIIRDGIFLHLSDESLEWLQTFAFPGSLKIYRMPPVLLVEYHVLPPKPWPLSIAGAPVFITYFAKYAPMYGNEIPEPMPGDISILNDFDSRDRVSDELFKAVQSYFVDDAGITAQSVLWLAGKWIIGVPPLTNESGLPVIVARALCTYREWDSAECKPHTYRWRRKGETRGDCNIPELRPGLRISTGPDKIGTEILSTSGICVGCGPWGEYMTISASAFPLELSSEVFQPDASGRRIAKVIHRSAVSDIGLAELDHGVSYRNYTGADNSSLPWNGMKSATAIRESKRVPMYSKLSMKSPALGTVNCIKIGRQAAVVRKPRWTMQGEEGEFKWTEIDWYYFGNGLTEKEPKSGSAGAPIFDENGDVVSLFKGFSRRYPGCGAAASASDLIAYAGLRAADKVAGVGPESQELWN